MQQQHFGRSGGEGEVGGGVGGGGGITQRVFESSTEVMYLQRCLVVTLLVPRKTTGVSAHVLCHTSYNHAPVYSVTFFAAIIYT